MAMFPPISGATTSRMRDRFAYRRAAGLAAALVAAGVWFAAPPARGDDVPLVTPSAPTVQREETDEERALNRPRPPSDRAVVTTLDPIPIATAAPRPLPAFTALPVRVSDLSSADLACLPRNLRNVLSDVSMIFGDVELVSTGRSRQHNRRVGGAYRSLHLACRAVDFRVRNAPARDVHRFLAAREDVGGIKLYRSGFIHIDDGPRRTW